MKLIDIFNDIQYLPTIIDFSDEEILINKILKLSNDEIINNKNLFNEIIKKLELSHTDNGIFHIDNSNYHLYSQFSNWLGEKNKELNLGISSSCIDNFLTIL